MSIRETHKTDSSSDLREEIRIAIEHFSHILPGQAPIKDFVHHNTLHGFQHLPFAEAIAAAKQITGLDGYEPFENFRRYYRHKRIRHDLLEKILLTDETLAAHDMVFEHNGQPICKKEIYLLALLQELPVLSNSQLTWQLDENDALNQVHPSVPEDKRAQYDRAAIQDLWSACLEKLDLSGYLTHPEELLELSSHQVEQLISQMLGQEETPKDVSILQRYTAKQSEHLLYELLQKVGKKITIRRLLQQLTGRDILQPALPALIRMFAAVLDKEIAAWRLPNVENGLFMAWKANVVHNPSFLLQGISQIEELIDDLPDDPLDTILLECQRRGLAKQHYVDYLRNIALELPGWSGMFHWRTTNAQVRENLSELQQINFLDYLAIRLVVERIYAQQLCSQLWNIDANLDVLPWYFKQSKAEFLVRYFSQDARLPEYLCQQIERILEQNEVSKVAPHVWQNMANLIWTWRIGPGMDKSGRYTVLRHGWRLFLLMQHLGMQGDNVRQLEKTQLDNLFDCLDKMQSDHGRYLLLQAYEQTYHATIFHALLENHKRGPWLNRQRIPLAQIVFCMDDREEGIRRQLEEINPDIMTFGAAGFFSVAMNYQGLDDKTTTPLCPIVVTPVHNVYEVPHTNTEKIAHRHKQRRSQRLNTKNLFLNKTRQYLLLNPLLIAVTAPFALLTLSCKSFFAATWLKLVSTLKSTVDLSVPTDLQLHASSATTKPTPNQPQTGFTDTEMADRVQGFLRTIGLVNDFAPLVILMGHGSGSQNNPHYAAYDCGACSGRHGGPNARAFAAMANREQVRTQLLERGIEIPATTWFIGAEHDTCDEQITLFDQDKIPDSQCELLQQLLQNLDNACSGSAHERSRRFASAPRNLNKLQARQHVLARAADVSQARPELGHATNAVAFIGRRSMSQGVFFDRRSFMISYDPTIDTEGKILENILLNAGPVGAGISLEYYFSTVNNDGYGCGSKVTHNVTGNFAVMEGTRSDLRTGLPQQMIEIHEAMRLQVICESTVEMVTAIYQRQSLLQELVGNGWLLVSVKDYKSAMLHTFIPGRGFVEWQDNLPALPQVAQSKDWYAGHLGPLPPALLQKPGTRP